MAVVCGAPNIAAISCGANVNPSPAAAMTTALALMRILVFTRESLQSAAMRRTIVVLFALAATLTFAQQAATPPILGFNAQGAANERALEAQYDAKLNRDNLSAWSKRLSARPHHIGSPYDKDNAEFIASLFKSFGWDTHIETFDVLFPTPRTRVVELIAPEKYTAKLQELALSQDSTSNQQGEQLPVYN